MNLEDLVLKDKFDIETAEKLFNYSFEEIEPIVPSILEWLQDGNWPVSRPVGKFISSLSQDKLGPYLMEIMNGNDYEWKYFLISSLHLENDKMYPPFLAELKRLAQHPTQVEIGCELQWMAEQFFN